MSDNDVKLDYFVKRHIVQIAAVYFPAIKEAHTMLRLYDPGVSFGNPRVAVHRDSGDGETARVEYVEVEMGKYTYEVSDRRMDTGRRMEPIVMGYEPQSNTLLVFGLESTRQTIRDAIKAMYT